MFGVLAEDEPRKQPGTLFEQPHYAQRPLKAGAFLGWFR